MNIPPNHYYLQSAVIPFRMKNELLQICLITSRKKRRWVIPKGVIEPDLTPLASAAKEALEEAGIKGRIFANAIGTYQYEKWHGTCSVEVFVMHVEEVLDTWDESFRDREWLNLDQATTRLQEPELQAIVKQLPNFINKELGND